jgi:hypothetical protein
LESGRIACSLEGVLLLHEFTRRAIKLTVVIVMGYHCYQLHTEFYPVSFSEGYVHVGGITGDAECAFRRNRATIQKIFCIRQLLEKSWE